MDREHEFKQFVEQHGRRLRRSAYVLVQDHGHAEDLVQTALMTIFRQWDRVAAADNPYYYAQRILYTTFTRTRRKHRIAESLVATFPVERGYDDPANDDREVVLRALRGLPRKQVAIVVLRFYEDMAVEDVAALLHCSSGTVKSQTAKALSKLRSSDDLAAYEGKLA